MAFPVANIKYPDMKPLKEGSFYFGLWFQSDRKDMEMGARTSCHTAYAVSKQRGMNA